MSHKDSTSSHMYSSSNEVTGFHKFPQSCSCSLSTTWVWTVSTASSLLSCGGLNLLLGISTSQFIKMELDSSDDTNIVPVWMPIFKVAERLTLGSLALLLYLQKNVLEQWSWSPHWKILNGQFWQGIQHIHQPCSVIPVFCYHSKDCVEWTKDKGI